MSLPDDGQEKNEGFSSTEQADNSDASSSKANRTGHTTPPSLVSTKPRDPGGAESTEQHGVYIYLQALWMMFNSAEASMMEKRLHELTFER